MRRGDKPYRPFWCYHKLGACCLERVLKTLADADLCEARGVIDSDDLQVLVHMFVYVVYKSDILLVLVS